MSVNQPPPIPGPSTKKSGMPTWAIILIVVVIIGIIGIAGLGMMAAIAVPNFVKAKQTAQMNACINHLRMIEGAKEMWALQKKRDANELPTESDIIPFLNKEGHMLVCPANGTYSINIMGTPPTCSIPTHRYPLDPEPASR